jgi:serine/threonine protein kinase
MEQVLAGARYLMDQGVIHRDLKPANILRAGIFFIIKEINGKFQISDSL